MSTPNDLSTPLPLSACHIGSFAYLTVKDRLPIILTRVIDYLYRERISVGVKYGEAAVEGCKEVVGRLSRLKNEIQTNKVIQPLEPTQPLSDHDDSEVWNREYENHVEKYEVPPKWFTSTWLYMECYMYARIHEALYLCAALKNFDPFQDQKQKSLLDSMSACESLAQHLSSVCTGLKSIDLPRLKQHVINFIQMSVWGNRCDLSISGGADVSQEEDLLTSLESLRLNLLVDHSDALWDFLGACSEDRRDIALVLDNAGFELVTDLCLSTLLMEAGLATSLTLYTKTRPWFVSDTTTPDLHWTIKTLSEKDGACGEIGNKWSSYLSDGRWKVKENGFWTTPHPFAQMEEVDPKLHQELSQSSLVIFKGDLNYRKLTSDLDWPTDTGFESALLGFRPAPLVALRTAKGGPVVGLEPQQVQKLALSHTDWNISGEFGMIQLAKFS